MLSYTAYSTLTGLRWTKFFGKKPTRPFVWP